MQELNKICKGSSVNFTLESIEWLWTSDWNETMNKQLSECHDFPHQNTIRPANNKKMEETESDKVFLQ